MSVGASVLHGLQEVSGPRHLEKQFYDLTRADRRCIALEHMVGQDHSIQSSPGRHSLGLAGSYLVVHLDQTSTSKLW